MKRTGALFLAALALSACTDPLAPDIDQLTVFVTLSKADITIGEATELRGVVLNATNHDLTIRTNTCTVVFRLHDSADQRFVEPLVCNDIEVTHVLRPGESIVRTVTTDGTGWISSYGVEGPGPGDYAVRAGVSLAFRSESPPVSLRIRAVPQG